MPYRALIWAVVTVGLALLAVGMWARAVEPMVAGVQATTQSAKAPAGHDGTGTQVRQMGILVKGTLLLSFVLICVLLVVGFLGTLREWMRFRGGVLRGKEGKTKYVDAWKIAGERMRAERPNDE